MTRRFNYDVEGKYRKHASRQPKQNDKRYIKKKSFYRINSVKRGFSTRTEACTIFSKALKARSSKLTHPLPKALQYPSNTKFVGKAKAGIIEQVRNLVILSRIPLTNRTKLYTQYFLHNSFFKSEVGSLVCFPKTTSCLLFNMGF